MKYFSMFSGIGGFELGIQQAINNLSLFAKEGERQTLIEKESQSRRTWTSNEDGWDKLLFRSTQLNGNTNCECVGKNNEETQNNRSKPNLSREWKENTRRIQDLQFKRDKPSNETISTCVGYSEIDKYAIQIYEKHFRGHKNYGNATKIKPEELPDFDLLVGGFPCQAFSIAGNRRGFEDIRGTLFFEIARVIKRKQPKMFLLENVKGLLNHDGGNTFTKILQTIDELGYDAEWQVLNSKHFGVPQNRERVFIVGHLRGSSGRKVFPIRNTTKEVTYEVIGTTKNPNAKGTNSRHWVYNTDKIMSCLSATDYKQPKQILHPQIADYRNDEGLRIRKDNMSPCLSTRRHSETDISTMPNLVIPVLTPDRAEKRQNGRRFKEDGEPSFTLTGQDKHGIYNGSRIRRLTPTECEFLQSFPRDWTKYGIETFNNLETYYKVYGKKKKTNSIEILQTLWETIGEEDRKRWGFNEFITFLKDEILQPRLYEESIQTEVARRCFRTTRELQSKAINYCNRMFSMWNEKQFGYSSQRQKQIEQLFRKLTSSLQKLPYEITPTTRQLEQEESQVKTEKQSRTIYVINELSDTQRYKCLGNAVTVNVIEAIIKRIKEDG